MKTALTAAVCALLLCAPQATHARPGGKGQNSRSQDAVVLVPGVSASDYLDGKRAKNGHTRAALTQGNVNYYREQFESLCQITLSPSERDEFQRRLVAAWPDGKYETDMPGAFKVLQKSVQSDAGAITHRTDNWARIVTRKAMVVKLQSLAKEDTVNGPYLLGLYNDHNRSLAPGDPPLTRKTTDALAERMVFMINEVMGKKAASVTPTLKEKVARDTIALWPKLSRAQRQKLMELEQHWAYFEMRDWPGRLEYFREQMRIDWGRELEKSVPAVRPMSRFRRERFAKAQAKSRARWAKMTPRQKQLVLMDLQDQARMNALTRSTLNTINVQSDAATLNIIEGISSNRYYYHVTTP